MGLHTNSSRIPSVSEPAPRPEKCKNEDPHSKIEQEFEVILGRPGPAPGLEKCKNEDPHSKIEQEFEVILSCSARRAARLSNASSGGLDPGHAAGARAPGGGAALPGVRWQVLPSTD